MKKSDVLAWLKNNQDERGIAHWKTREDTPAGMKSYGIGLVKLRKFAKSVGRDPKLAGRHHEGIGMLRPKRFDVGEVGQCRDP